MRVSTVWVCVQEVIITVSASCACYSVQQSCVLGMCVMCDCFSFLDDLVCWYWTFSPKLRVTYLLQHPETLHDSPQPLITLYHIKCPSGPFFFPSIYIQQDNPCPSVTIYSPLSFALFPPHPPTSTSTVTFPQAKEYFFSSAFGSFLSLPWLLKNPKFNLKNPYHSNLPCQSHSLFSLFLLPAPKHTRANTHTCTATNTHLFEIHISSDTNATLRLPILIHLQGEAQGPVSTHKHVCAQACKIISLLERWPQTSGQFLMDPDVKICFLFLYRVVRLSLKI